MKNGLSTRPHGLPGPAPPPHGRTDGRQDRRTDRRQGAGAVSVGNIWRGLGLLQSLLVVTSLFDDLTTKGPTELVWKEWTRRDGLPATAPPTFGVGVTGVAQGAPVEPVYTRGGGPWGRSSVWSPGAAGSPSLWLLTAPPLQSERGRDLGPDARHGVSHGTGTVLGVGLDQHLAPGLGRRPAPVLPPRPPSTVSAAAGQGWQRGER